MERIRSSAPDGVTAVLDLVGGDALEASPRLLAPGGRLASVIGPGRVQELGGAYWFVRPAADDLITLARLAAPVGRTFPPDEAADAHRLIECGHLHGKLTLAIG